MATLLNGSVVRMLSIGAGLRQQLRQSDAQRVYSRILGELEASSSSLLARHDESSTTLVAEIYICRSECSLEMGDVQAAHEHASEAVKYAPFWYKSHYQHHRAHVKLGNLADAELAILGSLRSSMTPYDWEGSTALSAPVVEALISRAKDKVKELQLRSGLFLDDDVSDVSMRNLQSQSCTLAKRKTQETEASSNLHAEIVDANADADANANSCGSEFDDINDIVAYIDPTYKMPCRSKKARKALAAAAAAAATKAASTTAKARTAISKPTASASYSSSTSLSSSLPLLTNKSVLTCSEPSSSCACVNGGVSAAIVTPTPTITVGGITDILSPSKLVQMTPLLSSRIPNEVRVVESEIITFKGNVEVELFFIKNDPNWQRYVEYVETHDAEAAYQWALDTPSVAAILRRFQSILAAEGLAVKFSQAIILASPCPSPALSKPPSINSTSSSPISEAAEGKRIRKSWIELNDDETDDENSGFEDN